MKILFSLIHFFMFGIGCIQLILGNMPYPVVGIILLIGYFCSGLSLFSIGGKMLKWIAIFTNAIFLIICILGLVYLGIISPLTGGTFDTVGLIGCVIIGLVGGFTIKLLKIQMLKAK